MSGASGSGGAPPLPDPQAATAPPASSALPYGPVPGVAASEPVIVPPPSPVPLPALATPPGTSPQFLQHPAYPPPPSPVPLPAQSGGVGLSVTSLVLGLVGLLFSWMTFAIPSILAVVFGHVARRVEPRGGGMAGAGLVLGYLVVGGALALALFFGLLGLVF